MSYQKQYNGYYTLIQNAGGASLGVMEAPVLEKDGFAFKDLARCGELLPYEDWRLTPKTRAKDLARRLSVREIAGLTLFSSHQAVPAVPEGRFAGTYDGKPFEEGKTPLWQLTDQQKKFVREDGIRTVLVTEVRNSETAARWNNEMQRLAEGSRFGIPISNSSDPRHGVRLFSGRETGAKLEVSKWPQGLGLAASFEPEEVYEFARTASKEYRAMGITSALSPQIDLATEPRWNRTKDTFGSHVGMAADMAKAYCDGLQTTDGADDGWGKESVAAMAKHWPGGGTGEGGRDAHFAYGKYAVYPGNNLEEHKKPFTEGAFRLEKGTEACAAVMPYYTISCDQDKKYGENVGNSYSAYMIRDLLRGENGYEGIVCTDWGVTHDPGEVDTFASASHGVEEMPREERLLKIIMNGVDQFGGDNEVEPVMKAYELGVKVYGEEAMRKRMEETAVRILLPVFRTGLFENPYLDPAESDRVIASAEFCRKGYEAQLKSLILLKNKKQVLPLAKGTKVFVPDRFVKGGLNFFGVREEDKTLKPVKAEEIGPYFQQVENPDEAEAFLVFMDSPASDGYSKEDREAGGNGYLPISLQYRPYKAEYAREHSIGAGDYREPDPNRSYKGKTAVCYNEADLDNVLKMRELAKGRPVVAVVTMNHPSVPAEYEPYVDAILVTFGVEPRAVFDTLTGVSEPSALLPVQLPKDMRTVEEHCEDLPFDLECYVDEEGHTYDFGFGMNWNGPVCDARTERYHR